MRETTTGTILCPWTRATINELRQSGFSVVSIIPCGAPDLWGNWLSWKEAILEKGKTSCRVMLQEEDEIPEVEGNPQYGHRASDDVLSLEKLLSLPEETLEEKREKEYQAIVDARKVTKDGTAIYVVPKNSLIRRDFIPPEENSVVIKPASDVIAGLEYQIKIPNEVFSETLVSGVNRWGTKENSDYYWIEASKSQVEEIVRKLTA